MARGQTRKGRYRAGLLSAVTSARPLLKARDHGEPVSVRGRDIGAAGERWVEPFFAANSAALKRLDLRHEVRADPEVRVLLRPGARIGAIPLLGPATRRVVAGFLVEPRFQWPALGAVFSAIGFTVEPRMGGALLVPGSAREVPPWLLAGPVLERLAGCSVTGGADSSRAARSEPVRADRSSGTPGRAPTCPEDCGRCSPVASRSPITTLASWPL